MKAFLSILSLVILATTGVQAQYVDDLYAPPTKNKTERYNITPTRKRTTTTVSTQKMTIERAQSSAQRTNVQQAPSALVTTLDEAVARREQAMESSPVYDPEMQKLLESYALSLEYKYDKNLYTVIMMNDKVWVEPKYITSLFANDDLAAEGVSKFLNESKPSSVGSNIYNINIYESVPYNYNNYSPFRFSLGYNYGYNYYYDPPYGGYYPYWGSSWGWPSWHNHYYPGGWYDPWYPGGNWWPSYHRPSYNRHPVYHGNSRYNNNHYYNGNGGGNRPATNARPNYNGNSNRPNNGNAFGRGQNPSQNQRPRVENQRPAERPTERPAVTPSRPSTGGGGTTSRPSSTGGGGGGTRRR